MLEQIAGKCEINTSVIKKSKLCHGTNHAFHTFLQISGESRPGIEGDATASLNGVDELAITTAQIEHAISRTDQPVEPESPKRVPKRRATRVVCQAGRMVGVGHSPRSRQPNTMPKIIRAPTRKALRSSTLPPLLVPTRWWNVIGHSTTVRPFSRARSMK